MRTGCSNLSRLLRKEILIWTGEIDSGPRRADAMARVPAPMFVVVVAGFAAGRWMRKGRARLMGPACHLSDLARRSAARNCRLPVIDKSSKEPCARADRVPDNLSLGVL